MIRITSIISQWDSNLTVRIHRGFKTDAECLEYCRCLELAHDDTCVEFHDIKLYSDVGDLAEGRPVRRYMRIDGEWTDVE
jgi:hypothetical protein